MTASWQEVMPSPDRAVYARAGYGRTQELPAPDSMALLVIDVTFGFTGRRGVPLEESQATYPNSCGPSAWHAVDAIEQLVTAFRAAGCPIIYSRDVSSESASSDTTNPWADKHERLANRPHDDSMIVDEIAPREFDEVIDKYAPSVFFGTDLARNLQTNNVDSLLVVGATTSGCVRASVVDAFSHGFGVFVIEEGVFDRARLSHLVSLFEINQKYGDVLNLNVVLGRIGQ